MKKRDDSDEKYVLDLISNILDCSYEWQKTFPDLLGDINKDGNAKKLQIDGYFEKFNLVVEYREKQHIESVSIMDKRMTISGTTRDIQRRVYDERREQWANSKGYKFLSIYFYELEHDRRKRLKRNISSDTKTLQGKIKKLFRELTKVK